VTPSLGKIWYKWAPTVRCAKNSRCPICLLLRPAAASIAISLSCGVSDAQSRGTAGEPSHPAAFDLPVTGRLPAGLNGRYLRNGPNPLGLDDPSYRFREGHWFLGPGMVHGMRLRDGKAAWYRNRWVRSRQLAEAMDEKWPAGPVHNDMDLPVTFSMDAVSAGLKLPYTWNPAHQARVGLLARGNPSAGARPAG
jgi:hypothetical protein